MIRPKVFVIAVVLTSLAVTAFAETVQLGSRPCYRIDWMKEGALKTKLATCSGGPFRRSDFSIGHRSILLQFFQHAVAPIAPPMWVLEQSMATGS